MNISLKIIKILVFLFFTIQGELIFGQSLNNGKITLIKSDIQTQSTLKNNDSITILNTSVIRIPLTNYGSFIASGFTIYYSQNTTSLNLLCRYSTDSVSWNNWERIEQLDICEEEQGIYRSELFFMDSSARYLEFQISIPDQDLNYSSIDKIVIFCSSPISDVSSTKSTSLKSYNRPAYLSRKDWGCPQDENVNTRELTTVTHLIIHHSAGSTTASDFKAVVLSYWDYHVNGNGWDDIGYNWLIDGNGVIYKGRAWIDDVQENVKGAHNSGKNTGTAGICMIGNYTGGTLPSSSLWNSCFEMLAFLCDKYSLNPKGTAYHAAIDKVNDIITGHRDSGGGTACPGDVANYYTQIRQEVADRLADSVTTGALNLTTSIAPCPSDDVTFSWTNTGTGWRIHVSTDPDFSSYYIKWVSNLSSYTGPAGFVLAPEETIPLSTFEEGTTYYYRMAYDSKISPVSSFTMPVCSTSNIIIPESQTDVVLYPNPAQDIVTIELKNYEFKNVNISIFDETGKEMYYSEFNSERIRVNIQDFPIGFYSVFVRNNDFKKVIYLIKSNN